MTPDFEEVDGRELPAAVEQRARMLSILVPAVQSSLAPAWLAAPAGRTRNHSTCGCAG